MSDLTNANGNGPVKTIDLAQTVWAEPCRQQVKVTVNYSDTNMYPLVN